MKKMLGHGFSVLIGIGALAFEMLESLNFWNLAFPVERWYLAYLGFFMTSIAMLGYFYAFMFTADGKTQKTTALVMTVVCGIGALLTAGVGFQITANAAMGFSFTESDIAYMALIVQALIAMHIIALLVYYGGDAIAVAWKDDDNNGIPDWMERKNKHQQQQNQRPQNQPVNQNALEMRLAELTRENDRLKAEKNHKEPTTPKDQSQQ